MVLNKPRFDINNSTVEVDKLNVTKAIGDNNSSSFFEAKLNNYTGEYKTSFSVGDEVGIYADQTTGIPTTKIFNGIIEDIEFEGEGLSEQLTLSGRDYTARLQDTIVEPEVYSNLPAGSIVKDIVNKYTYDVTFNNVDDSTIIIPRITFKYVPVFDAIKQLAQLAGYVFYIDTDNDLHFEEKSTVSSGYTFNNTNVTRSQFRQRRDTVFNEVWVRGDSYLDGYNETITAGSPLGGSIFNLLYNPSNTKIVIGGVQKVGGIYGMGLNISGVNYLVNFNDKQIIFTSGTSIGDSIPGSGTVVSIDYDRSLPIIAVEQDPSSQALYGKRVKAIIDSNIKDPAIANAIALQEITDNIIPKIEGKLYINNIINITPSQTCIVNLPMNNINNQTYDITEANYKFTPTTIYDGNVLDIKVNKKLLDITDKIKELYDRVRKVEATYLSDFDILTSQQITTGSLYVLGSSWYIEEGVATGSISYLYTTGFVPPTSPFVLGSATSYGVAILAGSFTGSAISHKFSIIKNGGQF